MTERPSHELRQLAAQLFAAGRAERPEPALGRRLLLIEPRFVAQRLIEPQPGPPQLVEPQPSRKELPAGRASASGASPRSALRSRFARALAAAALVAGCVGIWLASQPEAGSINISREHAPGRARPALSEMQSTDPEAAVDSAAALHSEAALQAAPSARASGEPHATNVAPAAAHAPPLRNTSRPRPAAATRSASPASAPAASKFTPPGAGTSAARASAPAPAAAQVGSPNSASHPPLTLLGELDLLKRARAALRSGDALEALGVLDTHARERGGAELIAEATLLRIEALSALGDRVTASDLATRFVRDNPHSALSDRAKSFIGVSTPRSP